MGAMQLTQPLERCLLLGVHAAAVFFLQAPSSIRA